MDDHAAALKAAREDAEYQDAVLESVRVETRPDAVAWSVTRKDGWTLSFDNTLDVFRAPLAGDTLRFFGRGIGYTVRGIGLVVGGQLVAVYRYKTGDEERAEHEAARLALRAEHVAKFEAGRAAWEAEVAALPKCLRERIAGFVKRRGAEWLHEHSPYETFVCKSAAAIHAATKDAADVASLANASADALAARGLSGSEHSGNTFGQSLRLASVMHRDDAAYLVPRMHAAICPLTGCADAGCFSTVAGEEARP